MPLPVYLPDEDDEVPLALSASLLELPQAVAARAMTVTATAAWENFVLRDV